MLKIFLMGAGFISAVVASVLALGGVNNNSQTNVVNSPVPSATVEMTPEPSGSAGPSFTSTPTASPTSNPTVVPSLKPSPTPNASPAKTSFEIVKEGCVVVFKSSVTDTAKVSNELSDKYGFEVSQVYDNKDVKGFVADIPKDKVEMIKSDDRVSHVEQN